MFKILQMSLIDKEKYNFGKLTLQGFGSQLQSMQKNTMFWSQLQSTKIKRQNTNLPIQKS